MSLWEEAEKAAHADEEIEGVIENVIYANEQNGYAVNTLEERGLVGVVSVTCYHSADSKSSYFSPARQAAGG